MTSLPLFFCLSSPSYQITPIHQSLTSRSTLTQQSNSKIHDHTITSYHQASPPTTNTISMHFPRPDRRPPRRSLPRLDRHPNHRPIRLLIRLLQTRFQLRRGLRRRLIPSRRARDPGHCRPNDLSMSPDAKESEFDTIASAV